VNAGTISDRTVHERVLDQSRARHWLAFPPRQWREQIPELVRSTNLGLALLTRNHTRSNREWIAQDLRPIQPATRGLQFGPLEDLLLLRIAPEVAATAAERLLAEFSPTSSQVVISLVLGSGPAAGRWVGQVWESGKIYTLDGFRLVGPGMHVVALEPPNDQAFSEFDVLYGPGSRTRGALGEAVWQRVRSSAVAVIGCGRNGSAAAMILTMLGVRRITLIDDDRDEAHGLDATLGANPEGIGQFKVTNRSSALQRLRPDDLQVIPVCSSLLDPGVVDQLRDVDLIVTCVDQDAPRLAAAILANRFGKLHLDIGTGVLSSEQGLRVGGDVRLLLPGMSCVVCHGGLGDLDVARYEVAAPAGALRRGPRRAWFEQRAGSLLTINLVAVNVGIQLWLDLLAGRVTESRWCRLDWNDRGELQVQTVTSLGTACSVCGNTGTTIDRSRFR
jgi:hypothetical protein